MNKTFVQIVAVITCICFAFTSNAIAMGPCAFFGRPIEDVSDREIDDVYGSISCVQIIQLIAGCIAAACALYATWNLIHTPQGTEEGSNCYTSITVTECEKRIEIEGTCNIIDRTTTTNYETASCS